MATISEPPNMAHGAATVVLPMGCRWDRRVARAHGHGAGGKGERGMEMEGKLAWKWKGNWVDSFRARVVGAELLHGAESKQKGMAYVEMVGVWYCYNKDPGHP